MALTTASFSIATTDFPGEYLITDTSTGTDAALTSRTIYLYDVANNLLVSAITWAIANPTYTLSLDYDIALNVRVEWATTVPAAYISSLIYAFTQYGEEFYFGLTQDQSSNPAKLQDKNYYYNKMKFRVDLDSASQAIDYGEDQLSAQLSIDRYRFMMTKSALFF